MIDKRADAIFAADSLMQAARATADVVRRMLSATNEPDVAAVASLLAASAAAADVSLRLQAELNVMPDVER